MCRRVLLALGVFVGCLSILQPAAHATGSAIELKILPIDCVFETVADGSNTLHYLTPAACGQVNENLAPASLIQETAPLANSPSTGIAIQPTQRPDATATGLANIEFVGDKTWSPIATSQSGGASKQAVVRAAFTVTAGIVAVATMVGFAVDIVLFEMRHTKTMFHWTRRFIPKKP